jgi:hypothetical protein
VSAPHPWGLRPTSVRLSRAALPHVQRRGTPRSVVKPIECRLPRSCDHLACQPVDHADIEDENVSPILMRRMLSPMPSATTASLRPASPRGRRNPESSRWRPHTVTRGWTPRGTGWQLNRRAHQSCGLCRMSDARVAV